MNSFTVREARGSDAEAIASVHVQTWQFAYRDQIPQDFLSRLSVGERREKWKEELENLKPKSRVYVAETVDTIVGFCSLGPSRDKDAAEGTGELYAIYIDAQSMGKGVGSALMQSGLKHLKSQGFTRATLWVLASNEKATKFYESKGWAATGERRIEQRGEVELREVQYAISL